MKLTVVRLTTYALMLGALGFGPAVAETLEDPSVLKDLQVQPLEGTLELSRADLELGDGPSSIALLRTHRPGWGDLRNFGTQWVSVLDARLIKQDDGSVLFLSPAGELHRFERDSEGVLRSVFGVPHTIKESVTGSSIDLGTLHFTFDAEGRLAHMRTAHSNLKLVRDHAGLVTGLETTAGDVAVVRDDRGALIALEVAGQRVDYSRDAAGNLIGVALEGRQESYGYDAKGRLTTASGGLATIAYDAQGRVTSVEAKGHPKASYERDETGRQVTYTVGDVSSTLTISEDGLRQKEVTGDSVSSIEFDERGRPVKVERDGETLTLSYDAQGRVVQQGQQRFLYGRGALPTGMVASNGQVTKFSYDAEGRMRSYRVGDRSGKQFRYDAEGRLTLVTGDGENVRYAYDSHGLLKEIRTPEGRTRLSRDAEGQLSMVHGPDGSLTEIRHLGGLEVRTSLDAAGNTVSERRFDALGRLVYEQDRFGRIHTLSYDAVGQLHEVATPAGTLASFRYTDTGEFAGITDGNGNPIRVERDGKRLVIEDAAAGTRVVEFDDQGLMLKEVKNGVEHKYTYDDQGRMLTRATPEGLERFSYDAAGNLTSLHGPQGGLEMAWENGKLARLEASPLGLAVEHKYDAEGRKVKTILPWGEVNYTYHASGALSGVQTANGEWIRFEADDKGRRTAAHYPGGVVTSYAYTGERLSEIVSRKDGDVIAQRRYAYGFDGAIKSVETLAGRTSFTRDAAGQIVEVSGPEGTVRYGYDAMGNRISESREGKTLKASFGEGNRIEQLGDVAVTHHPSGAIATQGSTSYAYTSKGQLAKVELADGKQVRYGYAPDGTRLWRQDENGKTFFLPGLNGVHGEFNTERELITGYVLGQDLDEVLAAEHGDSSFFYHVDLVRSVTALTDAKGEVAASYSYDTFGRELSSQGPASTWNTVRYASRPMDAATGDYDFRARTYSPQLGRFTSPDPISFLGGVNTYAYVANDPTAQNDPFGLFPGAGLVGDAVGGIVDLGRDTVGVVSDAGRAVGSAAAATGRAVGSAAVATGRAVGNATVATGRAIGSAASATGNFIGDVGRATVSGIRSAASATGRAIASAGRATGRFLRDAGYFAVGLAALPFVGAYHAARWTGRALAAAGRATGRAIAAAGRGIANGARWVWDNKADIGYFAVGLAVLPAYLTYKGIVGAVGLGVAAVRGIASATRAVVRFLGRLRLPFEINLRSPIGPEGGEFSSPLLSRNFESGTALATALEIRQILNELWPVIGSGTEVETLEAMRGRAVSDGARSVIDQLIQVYEDGADDGTSTDNLRAAVITLAAQIGADTSAFGTAAAGGGGGRNLVR